MWSGRSAAVRARWLVAVAVPRAGPHSSARCRGQDHTPARGVWAFAVVEHVNYFVVRLSYPATEWFGAVTRWRTPRLVQDVREARARD